MMMVAALEGLHADVVVSACMSLIMLHARQMPTSRNTMATSLRDMLAQIEAGQFPTTGQILGGAPAGQALH
jgi:hypothetical protein